MGTITVKLGTGDEHVLPWNDESTLAVVNITRPDPWNAFEARHQFSDVASVKINVKASEPGDEGAEVAGGEGEAQPEPQKKPKSARRPKAKP